MDGVNKIPSLQLLLLLIFINISNVLRRKFSFKSDFDEILIVSGLSCSSLSSKTKTNKNKDLKNYLLHYCKIFDKTRIMNIW